MQDGSLLQFRVMEPYLAQPTVPHLPPMTAQLLEVEVQVAVPVAQGSWALTMQTPLVASQAQPPTVLQLARSALLVHAETVQLPVEVTAQVASARQALVLAYEHGEAKQP
jgi:hypothetical protein